MHSARRREKQQLSRQVRELTRRY